MTREDKELLFVDLCARLPYNVLVHIYDIDVCNYDNYLCEDYLGKFRNNFIRIKPYLRPMSSMTEEELVDYKLLEKQCEILPTFAYINVSKCVIFDWLNKHHFDYRGLIEKGLAIEAPEEMYKLKEQQYSNY